jgi:hypothetical protein
LNGICHGEVESPESRARKIDELAPDDGQSAQ